MEFNEITCPECESLVFSRHDYWSDYVDQGDSSLHLDCPACECKFTMPVYWSEPDFDDYDVDVLEHGRTQDEEEEEEEEETRPRAVVRCCSSCEYYDAASDESGVCFFRDRLDDKLPTDRCYDWRSKD